ncbi:MAG: hypothetical protein FWG78_00130 [Coriobacteriia bacterium]|nr:hypothetical protein [Coriobacteriia bacterium]
MPVEENLQNATRMVNSYGAIVIVGAGMSASSHPMANELTALLWKTFDKNPEERKQLATALAVSDGPAKQIIDSDSKRIEMAWIALANSRTLAVTFKELFAVLDLEKNPTAAHLALAKMIKHEHVKYAVSLNWDTLLERAYRSLFGAEIPQDILIKPHGDARDIQGHWVFPYEGGVVPEEIVDRLDALLEQHTATLIEIGYSGSDEIVEKHLAIPLREKYGYYRVSPSATGHNGLAGTADTILPIMAEQLSATGELLHWQWVNYDRQRGLSAVLSGMRLGPQDVDSAPRLPGAEKILADLKGGGFAIVAGGSGSGKSLTAFQVARDMGRDGWNVIESANPGNVTMDAVRELRTIESLVVAVVDDCQAVAPDIRLALERSVSANCKIIACTTEWGTIREESTSLHDAQSVKTIKTFCDSRANELVEVVSELDNRVGIGAARESIHRRISDASSARSPWEFMSIMRGGDREIKSRMAGLSDSAWVAYVVIATEQLLSLDGGIRRAELKNLLRLNFVDIDCESALTDIEGSRLISEQGGYYRCPHIRFTGAVINRVIYDDTRSTESGIVDYIRQRLASDEIALKGKYWLVSELCWAREIYPSGRLVFDADTVNLVVSSCLSRENPDDVHLASLLLSELIRDSLVPDDLLDLIADRAKVWLAVCTDEDAFGLGTLISSFRGRGSTERHTDVLTTVSFSDTLGRMFEHGSVQNAGAWERLICEYSQIDHEAEPDQEKLLCHKVSKEQCFDWFSKASVSDSIYGICELIQRLVFLDPFLGTVAFGVVSPVLKESMEDNPASTARAMFSWLVTCYSFAYKEGFGDDYATYGAAIRKWIEEVDWSKVGKNVRKANRVELESFGMLTYSIGAVSQNAIDEMMQHVDATALEETVSAGPFDNESLQQILIAFCYASDSQPGRMLFEKYESEWVAIDSRAVDLVPELAVRLAESGRVKLRCPGCFDECAEALRVIEAIDHQAALRVLQDNESNIRNSLKLDDRHRYLCEDLSDFIQVVDAISPDYLDNILLGEGFMDAATDNWDKRLAGSEEERAAALAIKERASRVGLHT